MAWGWVNHGVIFIFGWTILLSQLQSFKDDDTIPPRHLSCDVRVWTSNVRSTDKRQKGFEQLIKFVVCYCKFNHIYRFLSSTFFENSWLAASLAVLGNGTQCLLTDQTLLDFLRADISVITEQQLWLTSENGAFVRACHSTRVPLS